MKQEKADSDIIALILKSGTDILAASNMKQEKNIYSTEISAVLLIRYLLPI